MNQVQVSRFNSELEDIVIKCSFCQEVVGMSDWGFGITCSKCHSVLTTRGAIFRVEGFPEVLRMGFEDLEKVIFFHKEFEGCEGSLVQVDRKFWELNENGTINFFFDNEIAQGASDDKDI